MARVSATQVTNNFVKGLQTENTGLNFPENACTETFNCVFNLNGEVTRRLGFDEEENSTPVTINRNNVVTVEYLWVDAGGDGTVSLVVQQIGSTLRFYNTTSNTSVSAGLNGTTIDLTTYSPSGAPSPGTKECQFSTGNGYLFVVHPNLEPFYVAYNPSTEAITSTQIDVKIRDFVGEKTDSNYDETTRPSSLTNAHKYNLLNQGWTNDLITQWNSGFVTISGTTTNGSTFVSAMTQQAVSSLSVGMLSTIGSNGVSGKTIVSIFNAPPVGATDNGSSIGLSGNASASGTISDMRFVMNNYPGNGDVWWYNKNAYDVFSVGSIAQNSLTTSLAPKGHYITSAWKVDRNTLSGLTGLTTDSSGTDRPSCTAFYAGRVWYGGTKHQGYNANLYFSQILDDIDKAGKCYQAQDPTDENLFDLLPNDGGVIVINGCGTVYKMFASGSSLLVFASNGVWEITGNQGIGLTAVDYSINRVSSVPSISGTNFVDVLGQPFWWNVDGIYTAAHDQSGTVVKSITEGTIQTFYQSVPNNNKVFVKGAFNPLTKTVQWLYRDAETGSLNESYEYDRILVFDTQTGAFYPWEIDISGTTLNGVLVLQGAGGNVQEVVLTDEDGTTHVVDGGVDVVVFSTLGELVAADFIYTCSTADSGSHLVSFANNDDTNYQDWASRTPVDFDSYFVSGYQVRGDGQRAFQDNYVTVHSDLLVPSKYYFQGIFDYGINSGSNRFGTRQLVSMTDTNRKYDSKRLLIRGTGKAIQFKVASYPNMPFGITGWTIFVTGNNNV